MASDSPAEAIEVFFSTLQQTISCVTTAVLVGRAYHVRSEPHRMSFGGESSVRLGRSSDFFLSVKHWYRLLDRRDNRHVWAVVTSGYEYRLRMHNERDFLTYHWHPVSRSPVIYPHLHVYGIATPVDLSKFHLPTGPITLVDVIQCAITEFGVEPLRRDWRAVLEASRASLAELE